MSGTPRVTAHIREEVKVLQRLGFTYARHDSRSHPVFEHAQYGEVTLPNSPRGGGWKHQLRRTIAERMGMTVMSLEALIAGQASVGKRSPSHSRPPRGRTRTRPPGIRHLYVAPETHAAPPVPEAPVVSFEPTGPITSKRRAHWAAMEAERTRANLENPWPWATTRRSAA